jgi:hypothetical protein
MPKLDHYEVVALVLLGIIGLVVFALLAGGR